MKTRILIATQHGPSEITKFTFSPIAGESLLSLKGEKAAFTFSDEYNTMINNMRGMCSSELEKSFQIEFSHPLDNDSSWNLGVYLAHRFWQKGDLALEGEDASQVLLVAGQISLKNKKVLPISAYEQRIDKAFVSLLELRAAGFRTCAVLPKKNNPKENLGLGGHVYSITHADELLGRRQRRKTRIQDILVWLSLLLFFAIVVWVDLHSSAVLQIWRKDMDAEALVLLPKNPYTEKNQALLRGSIDWKTIRHRQIIRPKNEQIRLFQHPEYEVITDYILAAPQNIHLDGDIGDIRFRVFSLLPDDGGACQGMQKRAANFKIGYIEEAFNQPITKFTDICGLRLLIFNTDSSVQDVHFSYLVEPSTVLPARNTQPYWRELGLASDTVYQQDLYFSLSAKGRFTFHFLLETPDGAFVNKVILIKNISDLDKRNL